MGNFIEEISSKWNQNYGDMEYLLNPVVRGYSFDIPENIPKQAIYYKMSYKFKGIQLLLYLYI